jgi:hypothetical protein
MMSQTNKIAHIEMQIVEYLQWIKVHYVGKGINLDRTAEKNGLGSPEFELELQKQFGDMTKHKHQMEVLLWMLEVIKNVKGQ